MKEIKLSQLVWIYVFSGPMFIVRLITLLVRFVYDQWNEHIDMMHDINRVTHND